MVTIRELKPREEQESNPNKVVVISPTDGSNTGEKYYCLMCQYSQGRYDSIMKYDKNRKVWQCCVCKYEIDESLNQTPKREHKITIENDVTITKPYAIPLNFNVANQPDLYESNATRPKPKYSSAREAWESI
jgi:hypothetical protein